MQEHELEWSPDALEDLDEIWDTIAWEGDPDDADSFIDQLKDIIPSFLVAFGAALPCYMLGLLPFPTLILLPFQILLWIILVLVICEKTKLPEYLELKSIVTVSIVKVLKKANYSRFF